MEGLVSWVNYINIYGKNTVNFTLSENRENKGKWESLRRNGVAIMVNKRVRNAILGCNLKNDRMISVRLQGKPFNITVIQGYVPNSMALRDATSDQTWRPAEFKHISQRRKRN